MVVKPGLREYYALSYIREVPKKFLRNFVELVPKFLLPLFQPGRIGLFANNTELSIFGPVKTQKRIRIIIFSLVS